MSNKVLIDVELLELAQEIVQDSLRGWFLVSLKDRELCASKLSNVLMLHDYNRALKLAYSQGDMTTYNQLKRNKSAHSKTPFIYEVRR